ncbi:MAG: sulfite exporter TauE/SafE family protein [Promethearchaeota archaeon]
MNFTWEIIIILSFCGLIFGLISVMSGQGGGIFYVSFITIFLLVPINVSIDTSNFIILLTSASGFLTYLKGKRTDLKNSLIYSGFSILGCLLSTLILLFIEINNVILRILFATLLLTSGLYMVFKSIHNHRISNNQHKENNNISFNEDFSFLRDYDYKEKMRVTIPLFLLAGFISNFLGIGGGVIITPGLNLVLNFPIHYATAVSTSIIFFTAIYNSITKLLIGQVELALGLTLGIGSIIGAFLGANVSKRMPNLYLQLLVAATLIGFAFRMYF